MAVHPSTSNMERWLKGNHDLKTISGNEIEGSPDSFPETDLIGVIKKLPPEEYEGKLNEDGVMSKELGKNIWNKFKYTTLPEHPNAKYELFEMYCSGPRQFLLYKRVDVETMLGPKLMIGAGFTEGESMELVFHGGNEDKNSKLNGKEDKGSKPDGKKEKDSKDDEKKDENGITQIPVYDVDNGDTTLVTPPPDKKKKASTCNDLQVGDAIMLKDWYNKRIGAMDFGDPWAVIAIHDARANEITVGRDGFTRPLKLKTAKKKIEYKKII